MTRESTNHLVIVHSCGDKHRTAKTIKTPTARCTRRVEDMCGLTFFTETTNGNAGLLSTHDKVRMMLCHDKTEI